MQVLNIAAGVIRDVCRGVERITAAKFCGVWNLKEHPRQQRGGKGKPRRTAAATRRAAGGAPAPAAAAEATDPPQRFGVIPLRTLGGRQPDPQQPPPARAAGPAQAVDSRTADRKPSAAAAEPNPQQQPLQQPSPPSPPEPHELPTPWAALQTPLGASQRRGRRWSPQHLAAQVGVQSKCNQLC